MKTVTPGADYTVKPTTDRLYEMPGIQRLLWPRPKIQEGPPPAARPMPRHTGSLDERKTAYRHWLEGRSKEDLIELIVGLDGREVASEATRKIMQTQAAETTGEVLSGQLLPEDLPYMRLPMVRPAANRLTSTWRVALAPLQQSGTPIGLEIDSEITVGRKTGDATPDLDLTPFGAQNGGVSRFHACIRPLINNLMLIDNDSSNGTFWNQQRLPTQTEQPLREGDIITFGRVSFLVRIVKSPNYHETKTLL